MVNIFHFFGLLVEVYFISPLPLSLLQIYLLDIHVFYTLISAVWGFLLGARDRLGEVSDFCVILPFCLLCNLEARFLYFILFRLLFFFLAVIVYLLLFLSCRYSWKALFFFSHFSFSFAFLQLRCSMKIHCYVIISD